jgi:hypothetical protein
MKGVIEMATGNRIRVGASVLLALALVLAAGCSRNDRSTAPSPPPQQQADLNDPNGGFTATNEQPAFGDAGLLASTAQEQTFDDAMAQDPAVRGIVNTPGVTCYAVTILWGMLGENQSVIREDGDQYDWSGTLRSNNGALVLVSTVSFESEDHMILPRPDKRTLAWVSHTGTGFDGVRLLVYQPDPAGGDQDSLTLSTALYTTTITFSRLDSLAEVVPVDSVGNMVSIRGLAVSPTSSTRGFLRGSWQKLDGGPLAGQFLGVWVSDRGHVSGFLRGEYGTNDEGRKVLFGKFVDLSGAFRGILRGTWQVSGNEASARRAETGNFQGKLTGEQGEELGSCSGHWDVPKSGIGFFEGRWCQGCVLQGNG